MDRVFWPTSSVPDYSSIIGANRFHARSLREIGDHAFTSKDYVNAHVYYALAIDAGDTGISSQKIEDVNHLIRDRSLIAKTAVEINDIGREFTERAQVEAQMLNCRMDARIEAMK